MFRLRRGSRDQSKTQPEVEAAVVGNATTEPLNGDGPQEQPQSHMNRLARTFNPLAFHTTSSSYQHNHHHTNNKSAAGAKDLPFPAKTNGYGNHRSSLGGVGNDDADEDEDEAAMQRLGDRDAPRDQKAWSMPSAMDSPALGNDAPVITSSSTSDRRAVSGRHAAPPAASAMDGSLAPMPDALMRAYNEALAPYQDRVRRLETDLARAQQSIQVLEAEKAAVHNWIDRRGLRPDLPPDLSHYFAASPVAAGTLAAQLERKMTMVNYSLHQLGDVLPHPPPASTITTALSALLPTIHQLAVLPGGPAGAFEALIKLAGNLNSHGTGDETDADRVAIANFYSELDDAMVRVVGLRATAAAEGLEDWDLSRDLERLQRTGAFLKKEMGVRNYFVRSQEAMRGEPVGPSTSATSAAGGGGGAAAATGGGRQGHGRAQAGRSVSSGAIQGGPVQTGDSGRYSGED